MPLKCNVTHKLSRIGCAVAAFAHPSLPSQHFSHLGPALIHCPVFQISVAAFRLCLGQVGDYAPPVINHKALSLPHRMLQSLQYIVYKRVGFDVYPSHKHAEPLIGLRILHATQEGDVCLTINSPVHRGYRQTPCRLCKTRLFPLFESESGLTLRPCRICAKNIPIQVIGGEAAKVGQHLQITLKLFTAQVWVTTPKCRVSGELPAQALTSCYEIRGPCCTFGRVSRERRHRLACSSSE